MITQKPPDDIVDYEFEAPKRRRWPLVVVGLLLLLAPIIATAWFLQRPRADQGPQIAPSLEELDIVCTGRVDAAGQIISLEPTQPGRVKKVCVAEGQEVVKDQEIVILDDSEAQARLAEADAAVESAKVQVDIAKKEAERRPLQIESQQALLQAAESRVQAAKKLLEQRRLQEDITPLPRAEEEALLAQISELQSIAKANHDQVEDFKKLDPNLSIRLADARYKAALASKELAQRLVDECKIIAPSAGTILRLQVSEGRLLAPGTPISSVVFAPSGKYIVRAEVDQEYLGRLQQGMKAKVQDDNLPNGKIYQGKVVKISGWVALKRDQVLDPGVINDVRTVECIIQLDIPNNEGLFIGQRMQVRLSKVK